MIPDCPKTAVISISHYSSRSALIHINLANMSNVVLVCNWHPRQLVILAQAIHHHSPRLLLSKYYLYDRNLCNRKVPSFASAASKQQLPNSDSSCPATLN